MADSYVMPINLIASLSLRIRLGTYRDQRLLPDVSSKSRVHRVHKQCWLITAWLRHGPVLIPQTLISHRLERTGVLAGRVCGAFF